MASVGYWDFLKGTKKTNLKLKQHKMDSEVLKYISLSLFFVLSIVRIKLFQTKA